MTILSKHLNRNCSVKEAIVYQMGKVGSTSIVASINNAGIPAYQSHFLDTPSFHEIVDMFDRHASVGEEASHHITMQLQENLLLRNKLIRYQNNEMVKNDKLGIITLVRDPLAWYFSNLSQNFFEVEKHLRRWLVEEGKLSNEAPLTEQHLQYFFTELFNCFDQIIPDMSQSYAQLIQTNFNEAGKTASGIIYRFIYSQVSVLHRVHFWFDRHFASLLDIDVLRYGFDKNKGYSIFQRGNVDIMLMKFEQLNLLQDELARFLGLPSFRMEHLNESKDKVLGQLISRTTKNLLIPDRFKEKYFSSEYYETFYQQDAEDRKSLSFPHLKKRRKEQLEIKLKNSPINDVSNYHKHKRLALESFFTFSKKDVLPEWPLEISIGVSNQCDIACAMCPSYSPLNKQKYQHLSADDRGFLDLNSLHSIEDFLQHAVMVHLGGYGEPTMHPEFSQLIGFLSQYEVLIEFSTHGLNLTETLCNRLVEKGVHRVNINISGATREDYENIYTGSDYDKVLNNIELLAKSKKKYGSAYPIISINSIAFDFHLEKLPLFVKSMAAHGGEVIVLKPLNTYDGLPQLHCRTTMMDPTRHTAILKKAREVAHQFKINLITGPFTNTAHLPGETPEDKAQFRHKGLHQLSTEKLSPGQIKDLCLATVSDDRSNDAVVGTTLPDTEATTSKTHAFFFNGNIPCFEPFKSFHVASDGRTYPCAFSNNGAPMGTLNSVVTGKSLWGNKEFLQLRQQALVQELPVKGCSECKKSNLYPKQHNLEHKTKLYSAWFYRVFNAPFHPQLQKLAADVGSNIELIEHKNNTRKTVYLHIGSPKTGTTSIQKYLSDNIRYHIDTQGLLYPKSGRNSTSHHPLAADLRHKFNHDTIPDHCYGSLHRGDNWEKLVAEMKSLKSSFNKVVISSEDFFTLYKYSQLDSLEEIKNILSDYDVIIVIYLRRQDKYIESLYNEEIKTTLQSRESADDLIQSHPTTRNSYYSLVSAWAKVFGKKKIIIRPFDPLALLNSDAVSDFIHTIGINDIQQSKNSIYKNKKLSRQDIIFKRELNKRYNNKLTCSDIFNTIIDKVEYSVDSKSTLLTESVYTSIKTASEPVNLSISKEYFDGNKLFSDFPDAENMEYIDEKQIIINPYLDEILEVINGIDLTEEDRNNVRDSIDALRPSKKKTSA